ncbi:MAG: hypothetical protein R2761_08700 [Acidimicrobiales bacterium]
MAKHPPAKMSAVLGRCRRTGRWRLGARSNVLAVLGSVRLDMRHSLVEGDEPDELKMKITVFFGSAVLILPEGAEVRPSGMSLLSAEWVDVPDHPVPSGLPTLQVEWTCVLGRVHVVTGSVLDKVAQEKAAADDDGNGDAGHGDQGDVGSDPWAADHRPDEISDPGPAAAAPVAEIVVDMGVVDSKPWSMSDFEQSELATEPAAGAPEESAPQLVEAWRTHDWGPGILQRDDEDDEEDDASAPAGASA